MGSQDGRGIQPGAVDCVAQSVSGVLENVKVGGEERELTRGKSPRARRSEAISGDGNGSVQRSGWGGVNGWVNE
jgi:hypothetical protein